MADNFPCCIVCQVTKASLSVTLILTLTLPWVFHHNSNFWLDDTDLNSECLKMERGDCLPFSIGAIVMSPVSLNRSTYDHNLLIHAAIRVWKLLKSTLNLRDMSFLLQIVNNPSFKPSTLDGALVQWKDKGIRTVGDLYLKGTFSSFQDLREKYKLNSNNFFRYL